jgi:hypothetical protein
VGGKIDKHPGSLCMDYVVYVEGRKAAFEELWDSFQYFFYHSNFVITDSPISKYKNTELWYKDQKICYAGWNKEKYKLSDWYGAELVICRNIPKFIREELIERYIYYNIYKPGVYRKQIEPWHEEVVKRLKAQGVIK